MISREGSVGLRRALIDLGVGLWLNDQAAKIYGASLRARGKKGLVIACAMAHRANKIAFALVRDQSAYDPSRWIPGTRQLGQREHLARQADVRTSQAVRSVGAVGLEPPSDIDAQREEGR